MALVKEVKTELVKSFQQHDKDTGPGSANRHSYEPDHLFDGAFQVAQEGPHSWRGLLSWWAVGGGCWTISVILVKRGIERF